MQIANEIDMWTTQFVFPDFSLIGIKIIKNFRTIQGFPSLSVKKAYFPGFSGSV